MAQRKKTSSQNSPSKVLESPVTPHSGSIVLSREDKNSLSIKFDHFESNGSKTPLKTNKPEPPQSKDQEPGLSDDKERAKAVKSSEKKSPLNSVLTDPALLEGTLTSSIQELLETSESKIPTPPPPPADSAEKKDFEKEKVSPPSKEDLSLFEKAPPVKVSSNEKKSFINFSSHLKIAEKRIKTLENENDELRLENQNLSLAANTLKENLDKLKKENKNANLQNTEEQAGFEEQKNILEETIEAQSLKIKTLHEENKKLKTYLKQDIKKIRFRERELENRLELKQNEMDALVREKDNKLIEMKREIDQIRLKMDFYKEQQKQMEEEKNQNSIQTRKALRTLKMCIQLLKASTNLEDLTSSTFFKNKPPEGESESSAASASLQEEEENSNLQQDQPENEDNSSESA